MLCRNENSRFLHATGKPLIASQIIRDELSFEFIQEVDFKQVDRTAASSAHDPDTGAGAEDRHRRSGRW